MKDLRVNTINTFEALKELYFNSRNDCRNQIMYEFDHSFRNVFLAGTINYLTTIKDLDNGKNDILRVTDYDCEIKDLKIIKFGENSVELEVGIKLIFKVRLSESKGVRGPKIFQLLPKLRINFDKENQGMVELVSVDFTEIMNKKII
jgi:hypothetical protein